MFSAQTPLSHRLQGQERQLAEAAGFLLDGSGVVLRQLLQLLLFLLSVLPGDDQGVGVAHHHLGRPTHFKYLGLGIRDPRSHCYYRLAVWNKLEVSTRSF